MKSQPFRPPQKGTDGLPLFPPFQRHSDTSRSAALDIADGSKGLRGEVLRAIRSAPSGLTDEEIQAALGMNPSTERPRRVELERLGLVTDSGQRRRTRSGRTAVVWKAITP